MDLMSFLVPANPKASTVEALRAASTIIMMVIARDDNIFSSSISRNLNSRCDESTKMKTQTESIQENEKGKVRWVLGYLLVVYVGNQYPRLRSRRG